jgi:homocitrate synthase NifV
VELGIAAPLAHCQESLVSFCRDRHPFLRLSLWSRCLGEDIEQAAVAGVDTISLSLPVSDLLLEVKLGRNRRWVEETGGNAVQMARELGLSAAIVLRMPRTLIDPRTYEPYPPELVGACRAL